MRSYRQVFSSPLVRVASFRCSVDDTAWTEPDCTDDWPGISFPLLPVQLRFEGCDAFVADPNTAVFLDVRRTFTRGELHEQGTRTIFFKIAPQVLAESVRRYDPAAGEADERLFRFTHGPTQSADYLGQRLLFEHAAEAPDVDPLAVEEATIRMIDRVVASAFAVRGVRAKRHRLTTERSRTHVSEAVKSILATRYAEPLALAEIAREVHSSPYHLCRIFRQRTGVPIHRYLNRLRLRAAIERAMDGELKLARVATDVGFARHSHLTQAFRREFGCAPSEVRELLSDASLPNWLSSPA